MRQQSCLGTTIPEENAVLEKKRTRDDPVCEACHAPAGNRGAIGDPKHV